MCHFLNTGNGRLTTKRGDSWEFRHLSVLRHKRQCWARPHSLARIRRPIKRRELVRTALVAPRSVAVYRVLLVHRILNSIQQTERVHLFSFYMGSISITGCQTTIDVCHLSDLLIVNIRLPKHIQPGCKTNKFSSVRLTHPCLEESP